MAIASSGPHIRRPRRGQQACEIIGLVTGKPRAALPRRIPPQTWSITFVWGNSPWGEQMPPSQGEIPHKAYFVGEISLGRPDMACQDGLQAGTWTFQKRGFVTDSDPHGSKSGSDRIPWQLFSSRISWQAPNPAIVSKMDRKIRKSRPKSLNISVHF